MVRTVDRDEKRRDCSILGEGGALNKCTDVLVKENSRCQGTKKTKL